MYDQLGPPVSKAVFAFVLAGDAPAAVPAGARYARRHPDGSVMVATGPDDTLAACTARWKKAKTTKAKAKKARTKKEA